MPPSISVLMPVHNAGTYVRAAIDSILRQTFGDFELIAIDDGSTDGSGAILDEVAAVDARVRVVHQENRGLVAALNTAIGLARAPLLARMDADDISLPHRFRAQFEEMRRRPGLAVLGGHARIIDEAGQPLGTLLSPVGRRAVERVAKEHSPVIHPAVMMRREAVVQVGGYRSGYPYAEDHDLWLRMLDAGYAVDNLQHFVLEYREHGRSQTGTARAQQSLGTLMAWAASEMRRAGLEELVPAEKAVEPADFDALPMRFRPSPVAIWEAQHGAVQDAQPEQVAIAVKALVGQPVHYARRAEVARFFFRAGLRLVSGGRAAAAATALARAFRLDPLVAWRQARFTGARRLSRLLVRAQYAVARLRGSP